MTVFKMNLGWWSLLGSWCWFTVTMIPSSNNNNNVGVMGQFLTPDGERRDQTYQVLEFENGLVNQKFDGILRYYCTFRGKWSEERHPNDFPRSPSFSAPVMISHSNGYRMWTGTETASLGVESIAEEGFTTIISNEFNNAGFETLQMIVGERQFNTTDSQHLPPINVTFEHPFLSSMVKITPSPDWFAGFSDLLTISPTTETYYNRIVIRSFIWDSGTDAGLSYTALDRDMDPQSIITLFTVDNAPPKGQFLSPDGTMIPIPCEYECILRVGNDDIYPGKPFNETEDIRPPLYADRDDDFIDGECCRSTIKPKEKAKKSGGTTTAAVRGQYDTIVIMMMMTTTAIAVSSSLLLW